MTDFISILTTNAPAWGVTLTLVIAGLIVAVFLLNRDNRRLEAAQTELRKELSDIKEKIYDKFEKLADKIDDKLNKIYDRINDMNDRIKGS
ncbi:hypothetical protein [Fibrobacter sp.]|uniref:hypothetical protein n=1 Tax=Fibrobacter sp. TaxID=35828 RepID=UPI00388E69CE